MLPASSAAYLMPAHHLIGHASHLLIRVFSEVLQPHQNATDHAKYELCLLMSVICLA